MAEEVKVSDVKVENHASQIEGISAYFCGSSLSARDSKTTIKGNAQAKLAFDNAQRMLTNFGKNMEREVSNIRSVGATFEQYDELMSELLNNA